MPAAEVAGLHRGRPRAVRHEPAVEAFSRGAERPKLIRGHVVAGHSDEDRRRPVSDEIGRDVAGAAEERALRAVVEHRDRRLRRDAPDLAFDEAVKQNVANNDDPCLSEAVYDASIHGTKDCFP